MFVVENEIFFSYRQNPMISYRMRKSLLDAEDYLVADPALAQSERVGEFYGKGFIMLGEPDLRIRGFDAIRFHSLLANQNPFTGVPIVQSGKVRNVGFECVFTPPKEVSIAALCLNDSTRNRAQHAFSESVKSALSVAENMMSFPHTQKPSGNVVASMFTHQSSRWSDPHIHCHVLFHNMAYDLDKGKWKAINPYYIAKSPSLLDHVFQKSLHENLRAEGIAARFDRRKAIVTIPPIPSELVTSLSKARNAVLAHGDRSATGKPSRFANLALRPEKPPTIDFTTILAQPEKEAISQAIVEPPKPRSQSHATRFGQHLARLASQNFDGLGPQLKRLRKLAHLHNPTAATIAKAVQFLMAKGFKRYANGLTLAQKRYHQTRAQHWRMPTLPSDPVAVAATPIAPAPKVTVQQQPRRRRGVR